MFGRLSFKIGKNEGMEVCFALRGRGLGTKTILMTCHSVYSTRKIRMVCLCYININSTYEIDHCG